MKLTELGVTQRETYERCPVLWYHSYLMGTKGWGLVPFKASVAQDFGSIGHKGLQTWYSQLQQGGDPEKAVRLAQETMRAFREQKIKDWHEQHGLNPEDTAEDAQELTLVDTFLEGYAKFYREDALFDIVAVEWDFSIPAEQFYPFDILEQAKRFYPGVELPIVRGTVDLIINTPSGLIVLDHKFHKFIDLDLQEKMTYWKQPKIYTRAVSLVYQQPIAAYVHNQIRKTNGLKPRLDKKTNTYESAEDFQIRLAHEYIDFPDYTQDYPDRKKGYFSRSDPLDVDVDDRRFLAEMACLDAEMAHKASLIKSTVGEPLPILQRRSPKGTCDRYGEPCAFSSLCQFGYNPATLEQFTEKGEPHP